MNNIRRTCVLAAVLMLACESTLAQRQSRDDNRNRGSAPAAQRPNRAAPQAGPSGQRPARSQASINDRETRTQPAPAASTTSTRPTRTEVSQPVRTEARTDSRPRMQPTPPPLTEPRAQPATIQITPSIRPSRAEPLPPAVRQTPTNRVPSPAESRAPSVIVSTPTPSSPATPATATNSSRQSASVSAPRPPVQLNTRPSRAESTTNPMPAALAPTRQVEQIRPSRSEPASGRLPLPPSRAFSPIPMPSSADNTIAGRHSTTAPRTTIAATERANRNSQIPVVVNTPLESSSAASRREARAVSRDTIDGRDHSRHGQPNRGRAHTSGTFVSLSLGVSTEIYAVNHLSRLRGYDCRPTSLFGGSDWIRHSRRSWHWSSLCRDDFRRSLDCSPSRFWWEYDRCPTPSFFFSTRSCDGWRFGSWPCTAGRYGWSGSCWRGCSDSWTRSSFSFCQCTRHTFSTWSSCGIPSIIVGCEPLIVTPEPSSTMWFHDAKPIIAEGIADTDSSPTARSSFVPATIYRDDSVRGHLRWSATATSIINEIAAAPLQDRAYNAAEFLGRAPVGAWEATFVSARAVQDGFEIMCHGTLMTRSGSLPTLFIRVEKNEPNLKRGDRLSISGRIVEISVDHPDYPSGLIRLEDGKVSR